ncbi:hypothetical protein BACCELL_00485 [Bacteroides cellulosilyticus DSM 14838]|uniref:Uncharacterized protein n=1 Tax=Bacteroides cellulosilyticus DSM 14838 TaxID=537012 RepID=E2N890_9BACE|nr:hypothetical protein BACCELL_00485 [Bacteroides cellulosilyticus DSM 14838]
MRCVVFLSQRIFFDATVSTARFTGTGAVKTTDGADVGPCHVLADEGAGDGTALAARLGDEADAGTGDLVGVHLLGAVHALAVGDAGVVESAQTFHVDGATGVHTAPQHQAEGFERGLAVGAAHGGDEGDLLAKLVHLDRFTHAHGLGMPLLGHLFVNRFEKCHTLWFLSKTCPVGHSEGVEDLC